MTLLTDNRTDWNFDENFLKIVTKAAEESLKYENFDPNCEISLSFVTNDEIHKINKQLRNTDTALKGKLLFLRHTACFILWVMTI